MYNPRLTTTGEEEDNVTVKPTPVVQRRTRQGFVDFRDFIKSKQQTTTNNQSTTSRLPPLLPLQNGSTLLKRSSVHYVEIIEKMSPNKKFKREKFFKPKRTLTHPKEPSKNHGHDNINDDYILRVNEILGDVVKYEILDLMGQGTFGQVAMCRVQRTGELVAVKVIKRQPAFTMQADKEIYTLTILKQRPEKHRFLQILNSFTFRGHRCAVFELLSMSLHKFLAIKQQQTLGRPNLAIRDIQKISYNILETLAMLKDMRIIHTDLKPDNILLKSDNNIHDVHDVKLIDYGSALSEKETLNYCVQTAFYRSPEVILHVEFDCAIDMWSFGCFVAELYLGRALFPSSNELVLIHMMVALLGCLPPDHMLKRGKNSNKFFFIQDGSNSPGARLRDMSQNNNQTHDIPIISKSSLEKKIMGFRESYDDESDDEGSIIDNYQDMRDRKNLYDFLKKILVFDPLARATPKVALRHPFITSAMGNISRMAASKSTTITSTTTAAASSNKPPHQQATPQQRPPFINSKSSNSSTSQLPVSPTLIFPSLTYATANRSDIMSNNSSSINNSQTTEEDREEVQTPFHSLSPLMVLNRSNNNSKELATPPVFKSPKINIQKTSNTTKAIMTPTSKAAASSPLGGVVTTQRGPLRSILKKPTSPPSIAQLAQKQENTLDSCIVALYQQLPTFKMGVGDPTIALSVISSDEEEKNNKEDYITAENTIKNSGGMQQKYSPAAMYNTTLTSNVGGGGSQFVNNAMAVVASPFSSINVHTAAYAYQQQSQQPSMHQMINNMGYSQGMNTVTGQQQAYNIPTSPLYHPPPQQQQQQQLQQPITSYSAASRHFSPLM